ncbi:uncharacterized protein BX664DRAFT_325416 [Halteromyces radiatus]|uniref:uncharacterized protein n=1 Tax=Halteromyces radiatus TaxID=101107 RepID=UPI00222105D3|nr:uncharacterized protein BX664DRAFT_325416 [Halteromyces radiatus]KAI8097020.1 hypothetical protein BX664DRAFT_325416 [Halteromyces radiatus]
MPNNNNLDIPRAYEDAEFVSEHLGFLPIDILDKLYNAGNIACYKALEGLKPYLSMCSQLQQDKKQQLLDKAFTLFEAHLEVLIDKTFNKFQQYFLDSILYIPHDQPIILEHYKDLDLTLTEDHIDLIDAELEEARNSVISQKAFNHWIKKEEKRLDRSLRIQEEYKRQLEFMSSLSNEYKVPQLDDAVQGVAGDLDKLQTQVERRLDEVFKQGILDNLETNDIRRNYLREVIQRHIEKPTSIDIP